MSVPLEWPAFKAGHFFARRQRCEELHVSPVAVSRQVGVLEAYFGVSLFERLHQSVQLTHEGLLLLPKVTAALDLLNDGTELLRPSSREAPVLVCTYTTWAMRWLIPRLPKFRSECPDIDISIKTAVTFDEFDYAHIDMGIQYVRSVPNGVDAQVILPDVIQPICSPSLGAGPHPVPPLDNLRRHTLLHSEHRKEDWGAWMKIANVGRFKPLDEVTFKGSGLAYQAAAEGLGVAVAQRLLVTDDLRAGRLIVPSEWAAYKPGGISLVSATGRRTDPRVQTFRDWLMAQAAEAWRDLGIPAVAPGTGASRIHLP